MSGLRQNEFRDRGEENQTAEQKTGKLREKTRKKTRKEKWNGSVKQGFVVGNMWIYLSLCSTSLLSSPSPLSFSSPSSSTCMLYVYNQLFNKQFSQPLPPTMPTSGLVLPWDKHRLQTALVVASHDQSLHSWEPMENLPNSRTMYAVCKATVHSSPAPAKYITVRCRTVSL